MKVNKKGFTLIEMLVVIAIIAVLVAIVFPTVTFSANKARAAADAANLRSILGGLNAEVNLGGDLEEQVKNFYTPTSVYEPDCELHVLYAHPGFIEVYFVKGDAYYSLEYLAAIAETGQAPEEIPSKPSTEGIWYLAGVGKIG